LYRSDARVRLEASTLYLFNRRGLGTVSAVEQSMTGRVFGWGPAALWAAVLFLLSELPELGDGLPAGTDKLVHGALYSILGLSLAWEKREPGQTLGGSWCYSWARGTVRWMGGIKASFRAGMPAWGTGWRIAQG